MLASQAHSPESGQLLGQIKKIRHAILNLQKKGISSSLLSNTFKGIFCTTRNPYLQNTEST
jgi:hypothetical protein